MTAANATNSPATSQPVAGQPTKRVRACDEDLRRILNSERE
jgi:hypothetical protein